MHPRQISDWKSSTQLVFSASPALNRDAKASKVGVKFKTEGDVVLVEEVEHNV